MNKLSCIPKIRISEVEVDIVCAYYGLSEEVSKYIRRLAFSNHLPFTMPTRIYFWGRIGNEWLDSVSPHGSLWIMDKYPRNAENGRLCSIYCAIKSIGGNPPDIINNFDKELPVGKIRNDVRNHILTLDGIFRHKASIVDQRERMEGSTVPLRRSVRQEQRPYKCITRSTWQ